MRHENARQAIAMLSDEDLFTLHDSTLLYTQEDLFGVPDNPSPSPSSYHGAGAKYDLKATNPKDCVGTKKVPFSTVPSNVTAEVGLAMLEGARKYGRHNYRVSGVSASVYYDAALRHLAQWWEGEDIDKDSGLPHVVKAIACLYVLRDAESQSMLTDDRPPVSKNLYRWMSKLNDKAEGLVNKYPNAPKAHTQKG